MDKLTLLRDNIEKLEKVHQLHILKILKKYNINFTENANGIFVNMTVLDSNAVNDIKSYIEYVTLQQTQLDKTEAEKDAYKKEFYKDNKEVSMYT